MRGGASGEQDRIAGCLLHRPPELSKQSPALAIPSNGTRGYGSADLGSVADPNVADIARVMGIDLDGGVRLSLCGAAGDLIFALSLCPDDDQDVGAGPDRNPLSIRTTMRSDSSTESAEQQPAGYYRAASARARRLEAEATTLKVKQYLREVIARCDRMAEEMEGHPTR